MMVYSGVVASALALITLVSATVGDNALDGGDRVVLVAPVLAPPKSSRVRSTDRSRQFPILVLLAPNGGKTSRSEPAAKSLETNPQPIYVQKLEDQDKPSAPQTNRQKRHLHLAKKLLGGGGGLSFGFGYGGGGGGYGGGYNGGYSGQSGGGCNGGCGNDYEYQEPKTVVVKVIKDYGGYGGGHGHSGGYGNGGGYQQGYEGGYGHQGGYGGHHGGYVQQQPHPVYVQPEPVYTQPSGCSGGGCGGCNTCGGNGGNGGGSSQATASATATATAHAQSNSNGYGKR